MSIFGEEAESGKLPVSVCGEWILYWFANQNKYQKVTIEDKYSDGISSGLIYSDSDPVILTKEKEGFLFICESEEFIRRVYFPSSNYEDILEQYATIRARIEPWCTNTESFMECARQEGSLRVFLEDYFQKLGININYFELMLEGEICDGNLVCAQTVCYADLNINDPKQKQDWINKLFKEVLGKEKMPRWFTVPNNETMVLVEEIKTVSVSDNYLSIAFAFSWTYKWVYDLLVYPSVLALEYGQLEKDEEAKLRQFTQSTAWVQNFSLEKLKQVIQERF